MKELVLDASFALRWCFEGEAKPDLLTRIGGTLSCGKLRRQHANARSYAIYFDPSAKAEKEKGETLLRMNIRKTASAFGILLLALMLVCAKSYAQSEGYGKYCNDNNNFDYFTHAECVTCMNDANPAVCFCRMMDLTGEEYGQCVSGAGASKVSFEVFGALLIGAVAFKLRRRILTRAV